MEELKAEEGGSTSFSTVHQHSCQSSSLVSEKDISPDAIETTIIEIEELMGNEEDFQSFIEAMEMEEASDIKKPSVHIQSLDLNCNEVKSASDIPLIDICSSDDGSDFEGFSSNSAVKIINDSQSKFNASVLSSKFLNCVKNPFYNGEVPCAPHIKLEPEEPTLTSPSPDDGFVLNVRHSSQKIPLNVLPLTPPVSVDPLKLTSSSAGSGDLAITRVHNCQGLKNPASLGGTCIVSSYSKPSSSKLEFDVKFRASEEVCQLRRDSMFDENSNSSDFSSIDINSPSPRTEKILLSESEADSLLEPVLLYEHAVKNSSTALTASKAFDKEAKCSNFGTSTVVELEKQEQGQEPAFCINEKAIVVNPTQLDAITQLEATSKYEAITKLKAVSTAVYAPFVPTVPCPSAPPILTCHSPLALPSPPNVPSPPSLPNIPSPPLSTSSLPVALPLPSVPSLPAPCSPPVTLPLPAVPSPPAAPFILSAVLQRTEIEELELPKAAFLPDAPIITLDGPSDTELVELGSPVNGVKSGQSKSLASIAVHESDKQEELPGTSYSPEIEVLTDESSLKPISTPAVAEFSAKAFDSSGQSGHNSASDEPSWSKPWVSTDDAENADNNDPKWELLREVKTDEERYKTVREQWRQLNIPDPRQDLTRHNFRRSHLQNARGVHDGNHKQPALNDVIPSRKRKRSLEVSDNVEHPSKRKRMVSCTSMFDHKIEHLRRQIDDDLASVNDEQQRALYNLGIRQQREQDNVMNLNAPHYIISEEIQKLFYHQEQEVDALRYEFEGRLEDITRRKMDSMKTLCRASKEVLAFSKFYQNLDNADDDHLHITEEELEQFQETEEMYDMFIKMYTE